MTETRKLKYKASVPMHVLEGRAPAWEECFAWRPVKLEQGGWAWLRKTWRRRFVPPMWFTPPAPWDGWIEYSDHRLGFWQVEVPSDPYLEDLIFANEQNIKAARKYKARLEYMEAKYGQIDWDAAPSTLSGDDRNG